LILGVTAQIDAALDRGVGLGLVRGTGARRGRQRRRKRGSDGDRQSPTRPRHRYTAQSIVTTDPAAA
jgi:hypothetical protein